MMLGKKRKSKKDEPPTDEGGPPDPEVSSEAPPAPAPSGVRKKLELYPWRKPKGEQK